MTQEPEEFEAGLNIKRGLKMAVIFAVVGFFSATIGLFIQLPILEPEKFKLNNNVIPTAYSLERLYHCFAEIFEWASQWINKGSRSSREVKTILTIITMFACTAWATYAPNRKCRFGWTMAIIFALSLPFWSFGMLFMDGIMISPYSHAYLLLYTLPSIALTIILSILRAKKREPEQKNPEQRST